MKKRIISLVLFIVMVVQLLPTAAFAAKTEPLQQCGVMSSGVQMNPLYNRNNSGISISSKYDRNYSIPNNANYITSPNDAAAVLRNAQEQRQNHVTFYYYSTETPSVDIFYDIWERSQQETGVPTQGDYLRWVYEYYYFEFYYQPSGQGYEYSVSFDIYYYTNAYQENALTQEINYLLDSLAFSENTSDIEKIATIYTFLCSYVTYDYDTLYDDSYMLKYTAYAALMHGTAVCQGYAVLFYRLMRELDVPVRVITGQSNGVNHAWNIVAINGKYYNMDSTWDSNYGSNIEYYQYFMRSPYTFPTHDRNYEYTTGSFHAMYPMSSTDFSLPNGWYQEDENWFFVRNDDFVTGWLEESGYWYYMAEDGGRMQTGWVWDGSNWYYMDTYGAMATGWVSDGQFWYYMNPSGTMATGWVWDGNNWYYMNPSGTMATGWVWDGSSWYYMNLSGTMATGWVWDGSNWYYMNPSGTMATGWVWDGNNWYYMNPSGTMVTGTQNIDGITYVFADSGIWIR